ncbi:Glutamyl-tRNA amidotransferase subunit A, mitochondrial [Naviculisporaceae sp. PSN 640]
MAFNTLTATALDLRHQLETEQITSVQIIDRYLGQILRFEPRLNALISVTPREVLDATARRLDHERRHGRVRGPLHGIPVILKDCFTTSAELGMDTTAGSWAFIGAKAKSNAALVQKLVDAGMIILGKANMTEFAGLKTTMMMPGWSAYGGQTLSPYVGPIEPGETVLGHSAPGGSSTGSAVSVAAGFAPLTIGAETIGSIITPASRAALYAIKPTVGVQDTSGMFCISEFFDSPGPMAKSVGDLAALMDVLLPGRGFYDEFYGRSRGKNGYEGRWSALSNVAFVDPRFWKTEGETMVRHREGTQEQMVEDYQAIVSQLREDGCPLKYPVELEATSELTVDGEQAIMPIAFWEFKNICIPRFIDAFDESSIDVHSLADIVKFNEENRDKCLPEPYTEQNDLLKALHNTPETEEQISRLRSGLRQRARQILDWVFSGHHEQEGRTTEAEVKNNQVSKFDIIAGPADSPLCVHAAAAGYPVATVPLGQLRYNKRPFGLCLVAGENQEAVLLRFMRAYESLLGEVSGGRAVPDLSWIKN